MCANILMTVMVERLLSADISSNICGEMYRGIDFFSNFQFFYVKITLVNRIGTMLNIRTECDNIRVIMVSL